MRVGEIWEYMGPSEDGLDVPGELKLQDDRFVRIDDLLNCSKVEILQDEDEMTNEEILREFEEAFKTKFEMVLFSHLISGATGILDRADFVRLYKKVYNHPEER